MISRLKSWFSESSLERVSSQLATLRDTVARMNLTLVQTARDVAQLHRMVHRMRRGDWGDSGLKTQMHEGETLMRDPTVDVSVEWEDED